MRRLLLAVALALGVLVCLPGPALACSCVERSLPQLVHDARSVGVGRVEFTTINGQETVHAVRFSQVYKGSLGTSEKVISPSNEASCGLGELAEERDYVFFLQGTHRGVVRTNLCSAPMRWTADVESRLRALTGPARDPVASPAIESESPPQTQWWWAYAVGLVAIVLVAVAVTVGRRRLRRTPGELDARTRSDRRRD